MGEGRRIRTCDVAAAASWHFSVSLNQKPQTRQVTEARRVAYVVCRRLGFSLNEIGRSFDRDHTTIVNALRTSPDPDDVAAVLANARARAVADVMENRL